MDTLENKNLMDIYGKITSAKSLLKNRKFIMYYFSASWCGSCNLLLPKIKKIYQESCKRKLGLEIIYVSFDDDPNIMLKYFKEKHGGWYAIPFGDNTNDELKFRYGVTHIPYLVVTKIDGIIISKSARQEIEQLGIDALIKWMNLL